jgi:hypothetical protein
MIRVLGRLMVVAARGLRPNDKTPFSWHHAASVKDRNVEHWLMRCLAHGGLPLRLVFELVFGRLVLGLPWERLAADYHVLEGGLLPLGMIVLLFAPLIAGKLWGTVPTR